MLLLAAALSGGFTSAEKARVMASPLAEAEVFDQDKMWDAINADPATGRAKAMAFLDRDPPLTPDNRRRALNIIGVSFAMQGRMDEALVYAHQALDMAVEQNDFVSASRGWSNIALMEQARGGLAAAVEAYANAVELSKKADQDAVAHDHTLTNFGALLLEYGRPDDAIELLEEARPVLLADERPTDRANGFLPLAQAYRRVGRLEDAGSLLREIRGFLDLEESAELTAMLHCEEANLSLSQGRAAEARSAAERCLSVAQNAELLIPQVDAQTILGRTALSGNDVGNAKTYYVRLLTDLDLAESAISAGSDEAPSILRRRLEANRLASDIARREGRLADALDHMNMRIEYDDMLDGIASKAGSALDTFRFRQEINTLNVQLLESEAATLQTRNEQQRQFIVGALLLSGLLALLAWVLFRSDREKRALNAALKSSLDDQRLLNLDIQHRVRNNLQVLLSLLNLQLQSATSEGAVAVKSVKNRIVSMATLYSTLYAKDDADIDGAVGAREMLPALIGSIASTYGAEDRIGKIELEDIHFDKATASPLGLLLAELISNVFKHTTGRFDLSLVTAENGNSLLTLTDEGPTFSADTNVKSGGGLDIVRDFAEQIEGTLEHHPMSPTGNKWTLKFPSRETTIKR